jgi:hypothetical protein
VVIDEKTKKKLGKFVESEVIAEYGETITVLITFENGTCEYECNNRTGKTKGHKYEYNKRDNTRRV